MGSGSALGQPKEGGEGVLRSVMGTLLELEKSLASLSALWRTVEDSPEQSHEPLIGTQLSSVPDGSRLSSPGVHNDGEQVCVIIVDRAGGQ